MAGMGKVARYYLRWLAMFLAIIAAFFAADIALCLILGSDWFGGIYLSMANFLFLLMFGIATMQPELASLSAVMANMPWWLTLELALLSGTMMSDFGILAARGGWAVAGGILLMMLTMFLLMALPALCALLTPGGAERALLAASPPALTAIGLLFILRHLRRLEL